MKELLFEIQQEIEAASDGDDEKEKPFLAVYKDVHEALAETGHSEVMSDM